MVEVRLAGRVDFGWNYVTGGVRVRAVLRTWLMVKVAPVVKIV